MRFFLPVVVYTLLGAAASAQQASFTFFGSPSPAPAQMGQHLTLSGAPQLGATVTLSVDYTPPYFACTTALTTWAVWLVAGFSNQAWAGGSLPSQVQGITLLVSPDVVDPRVVVSTSGCPPGYPSGGLIALDLVVPNDPALIGVKFYEQVLMARLNGAALSLPTLIATDAVEMNVGL